MFCLLASKEIVSLDNFYRGSGFRVYSPKRPYDSTNGIDPTVTKRRRHEMETKSAYSTSHTDQHNNSDSHRGGLVDLNSEQKQNDPPHHITESTDSNLDEETPDYLKDYTTITTPKQRYQYKDDFYKYYDTYLKLYETLTLYTKEFDEIKCTLLNEKEGTAEYTRLQYQLITEYKEFYYDKEFQNIRNDHSYLHKKLIHIKQLVTSYDNTPGSVFK